MVDFLYTCIECGRSYPMEPQRYLCDECSAQQQSHEPLRGQLETVLSGDLPEDWKAIHRGEASWADPRSLLPVEVEHFPTIPVGNTPLWAPEVLRKELGIPQLYFKADSANPTGSLKDRASYLVAAFARRENLHDIVVASTGNAGSSMAGVAASAGLHVRLYLPASAPAAKIVQARQYGAHVITVDGTYDDAFDQSLAFVTEHGGLSRNTAHNPLTVEGKKTVSLEMFLQLGCRIPDRVYVATGDGVILSGVYKGFEDLVAFGLAPKVPEIVCVQAQGSQAIHRALVQGHFGTPVPSQTLADSISVDVPRGGYFALGRLQRHNGRCVVVEDHAILRAQRKLASSTGLFAEPAAACAFAGLLADEANGHGVAADQTAVVLITGDGLKDIKAAAQGVES